MPIFFSRLASNPLPESLYIAMLKLWTVSLFGAVIGEVTEFNMFTSLERIYRLKTFRLGSWLSKADYA